MCHAYSKVTQGVFATGAIETVETARAGTLRTIS
jgi:hypothetical protein